MTAPATEARYGPHGFFAALATIALVETVTWVWIPYWILSLYCLGIATVIVVPTGFFMSQANATKVTQVGRGILIGYLATPLTIALAVIPPVIVTQLLHLA
ncbi:hypothetical protein [[Mycobacterium] crassicus]|uniref:DUF4190 domain-containing protein n=1 Tax=[Mycobacterium] crassicus TaxID=2872309 RepID=A0ABU5XH73_9MYCO|nr:hypothetical protein [Mycolicibacter sp. MYC098]MEB3021508.1 hypothetical protein [Mycolicibacter sp. MYC098]